jgi:hypothetical protein
MNIIKNLGCHAKYQQYPLFKILFLFSSTYWFFKLAQILQKYFDIIFFVLAVDTDRFLFTTNSESNYKKFLKLWEHFEEE